jgi:hypothetical protein
MRAPTEARPEELREAHDAADTLISERFRSYLPGRMLPMLLGKFRDDVAESLGMELPPLPRRSGPVKVVKLDDLTSSELGTLSGAVLVLARRPGARRPPRVQTLARVSWRATLHAGWRRYQRRRLWCSVSDRRRPSRHSLAAVS